MSSFLCDDDDDDDDDDAPPFFGTSLVFGAKCLSCVYSQAILLAKTPSAVCGAILYLSACNNGLYMNDGSLRRRRDRLVASDIYFFPVGLRRLVETPAFSFFGPPLRRSDAVVGRISVAIKSSPPPFKLPSGV